MSGIAVSIIMLLIKGIPESMLNVLALHFFTRTKINIKIYFLLSFIYLLSIYLIRFLPITLGVNTVLSLFVLILSFQFVYRPQLSKVIRTITASAIILILVAISEVCNMLLLTVLYGETAAMELFNSSQGLTKSIYTIPSTVFLAIFVFAGYLILKKFGKRKISNGEDSKKIGA